MMLFANFYSRSSGLVGHYLLLSFILADTI